MKNRGSSAAFLALIAFLTLPASARAQQMYPRPNLLAMYPAGGQAGQQVVVRITEHFELNHATGLLFSHPGIRAEPIRTPADRFYPERNEPNTFTVRIAENTPPGVYQVRAISRYGLTNARRFVVSTGTEALEEEPNDTPDAANSLAVGTTINGTFGADYDHFRIAAKKGERLIVQCLAERLDSRGDPVVSILDSSGRILRRVHDTAGRDPVADFIVPIDGEYIVRLNDLVYTSGGGNGTAPYRLSVTTGPWIDFVEPRVGQRGKKQTFTLYGRNIGGKPGSIQRDGTTLEELQVEIQVPDEPQTTDVLAEVVLEPTMATTDSFGYRLTHNGRASNPVSIAIGDTRFAAESEPNNTPEQAQRVSVPASVYGRFDRAGDVDSYTFYARQNEVLCISVQSQRLGFPTDAALVIQQLTKQDDGTIRVRDLRTVDDPPRPRSAFRFNYMSEDPAAVFVAPSDGTYRVLIRDQFGGSANSIPSSYLFSVRHQKPDFRILAAAGLELGPNGNNNQNLTPRSCVVRRGAATEIMVSAHRIDGFDGEVVVRASGLPKGITASPAVIGPEQTLAALLIHADAQAEKWIGPITLTAEAKIGDAKVTRPARPATIVWANLNNQPAPARLTNQIMLCVDDQTKFPGRIRVGQKSLRMARGGRVDLTAKFEKQGDFSGTVACQLYGLPTQIGRVNVSLNSNGTEAKGTLDIRQDCPPGRYSVFLRGDVNQNYRLYEDAAELAKQDQQRIGKLSQQFDQAYNKAVQARSTAEREYQQFTRNRATAASAAANAKRTADERARLLKDAQTRLAIARKKLEEAQRVEADAQQRVNAATDEATKNQAQTALQTAAQAVARATTERDGLQKQTDEADRANTDAKSKLMAAEKAAAEADKKFRESEEKRKKANDAQQTAQKDRDLARRRKQEADREAQRANQLSQQRQKRFYAYSEQIELEVVPYPMTLTLDTMEVMATAGSKTTINATVKREFEFADAVSFTLQPPRGVGGWSLSSRPQIEKDKDQGSFELVLPANAKPGKYEATISARIRFNNRQLDQRIPIKVTVAAETTEGG